MLYEVITLELHDLALGDGRACLSHQTHYLLIEEAPDGEGLDEQEISTDQRFLQSELLVRGLLAPSHLRTVVDVIVDEGGGMDHLEGGGDLYDLGCIGPPVLV